MNDDTPRTDVAKLLREALSQLDGRSDSARLDAELLLSQALGKPRSFLYAWPDHAPTATVRERFSHGVDARAEGVPVAYLLGSQEFHGLDLAVTPDVLVPRADTETLVDAALEWLAPDTEASVLDLGTGSGAVALAIASARPLARVSAVDISEPALRLARANAESLGLNVDFRSGDWCAGTEAASLDMVVSNPPYIAEDDPHLPALRHEPRLALVSGADGLDALRRIVVEARAAVRPGGSLLVEHGWRQGEAVRELFRAQGWTDVESLDDLGGNERVTRGRAP